MAIYRSGNKITKIDYNKNKYSISHYEDIPDSFFKRNQELKKDKKIVWSSDKEKRHIARVPLALWIKWYRDHPELRDDDPEYRDRFLYKLLKKQENEVFRVVENI